jgi:DNA polymerase-3 subunit gamma/tau
VKESSEVLARKYRPENFEELIGQETIAQTLSLALDAKRLSHAYLFSGLRGSGKTSTARIFAKALICEQGPTSKPCGVCEHCQMAKQSRHMDIIEMDAASSRKIDDIRDLIEHTKYKPASANFKIFIIDEVHMLTKEAFNALLKTLEEPPAYVKFILATTDPLKLPATILSRTQHFRFKKISHQNIMHHLAHILHLEQIEYQNDALDILARSGSGSLRDTLTLLDQAIIYSRNFVDVKTVTDMLGLIDPEFIGNIFKAVFAKDHAALVQYTKALEDYEAEMVVDELIAYLKERLYAQDPLFSTLLLERFFRILSDAKSLFALNADGAFVINLVLFKMVEALRVKEIDQMIESLEGEVTRPASIKMPEPMPTAPMAPPEPVAATASDRQPSPPQRTAHHAAASSAEASEAAAAPETQTPQEIRPAEAALQEPAPAEMPADRAAPSEPAMPSVPTPTEEPAAVPQTDTMVPEAAMSEDAAAAPRVEETAPLPEPEMPDLSAVPAGEALFQELCTRITDRSAELGHCFANQVHFVSYENETLTWESCVDAHCKAQLRHGYSVIKQFVREIFGFETKIKNRECSKSPEEMAETIDPPAYMEEQHDAPRPTEDAPQAASMTEEVETGSGSCVTGNCSGDDQAAREFNGAEILEEPMVLKAKELFEATKITIQNKV